MHAAPADPVPAPRRLLALVAMAPALFAVVLYAPALRGGLLADDLLLASYVVEPTPDGFAPAWGRVAGDFVGPWAFVHGAYYRPLATLSMVLDQWAGGGAEWVGHASAVVFAAAAAFAVAWLCGVLFGPFAALLGGALFAAHPALHEPVCWACTRTDLMVVAAMACACSAFVRHLRGDPGRNLPAAHAAFAVALLAKEVGLWTLAWFALLDAALRGRAVPIASRVRTYAPFVLVAGAYWLLRAAVLDRPLAEAATSPLAAPGVWLARAASKVVASVAPHGDPLPATLPWTLGAALAWAAACAIARRGPRRWLAAGVVWWLGSLLPAQWHEVSPSLEKSRYLIAGLVGLCVAVAASLGARAPWGRSRWPRVVGLALVALAMVDLARATRALQAHYAGAWQRMARLRERVDAAGARATVDAPLVMLAGAPTSRGIPFLEPTGAYALAQPPLASGEHPFVCLGTSLRQGIGAPMLEGDIGPWRQLWRHGATLCYWQDDGDGRLVEVPPPTVAPMPRFSASAARGAGWFACETAGSPWPVGGFEVVANAPFARGDLVWHTGGGAGLATLPAAAARDGRWTAVADVHDDTGFLVLGTLHGIAAVQVALHGGSGAAALEVRVVPPDEPVPLRAPQRGTRVGLRDVARHLPFAELPARRDAGTGSAVLLTKAFPCRVTLAPDGTAPLPESARIELVELERFSRYDRVWYYLECRVDGRRWRSTVDWFERPPGQ